MPALSSSSYSLPLGCWSQSNADTHIHAFPPHTAEGAGTLEMVTRRGACQGDITAWSHSRTALHVPPLTTAQSPPPKHHFLPCPARNAAHFAHKQSQHRCCCHQPPYTIQVRWTIYVCTCVMEHEASWQTNHILQLCLAAGPVLYS